MHPLQPRRPRKSQAAQRQQHGSRRSERGCAIDLKTTLDNDVSKDANASATREVSLQSCHLNVNDNKPPESGLMLFSWECKFLSGDVSHDANAIGSATFRNSCVK